MLQPTLSLPFCLFTALSVAASTPSYVVVQDMEPGLLRVSADGLVSTIAEGVRGLDLSMDPDGNYVVTTGSALLRVTRGGKVSTIATAPSDSKWIAIALDAAGNAFVADEPKHEIWRISGGGQTTRVARYPGSLPIGGSDLGLTVEPNGDYLVMRIDDDVNTPRLYRITPGGAITLTTKPPGTFSISGPMARSRNLLNCRTRPAV